MTAVHEPVDTSVSSKEVPTASPERFERFTAKEAEIFLARRFSIFLERGLDCTSALLLAARPEED
jgi:hypothetical protein